ncbi:protein of unassigned function [Methylobacterium oryzae CBMB20]|uniref:Protein of unassigned function n=1 Tax=Methylobacterium oryzae CBMB20 TaxID=693986 RepID=A0A089P1X3_9HYPH|nr:protein of unassigned function [Methylobacterium oryzae CBMB20]
MVFGAQVGSEGRSLSDPTKGLLQTDVDLGAESIRPRHAPIGPAI